MLILATAFALFGSVSGEGYWDLELSPHSVGSVPFGTGHISVFSHSKTLGRYYAMPLGLLVTNSPLCYKNLLTGKDEMFFEILLWSNDLQETVHR